MNTSENPKPEIIDSIEEDLANSIADMQKHIDDYFGIGGVELPCDLLKDVACQYAESMKSRPTTDRTVYRILDTMELLSFISILFAKSEQIKWFQANIRN